MLWGALLAAICLASFGRPASAAPPTPEQRTLARTADTALKKAGNLYRSKKFAAAGEAFKDAQQSVDQLAGPESRELAALTAPLQKQLAKMRDLLQAEGLKLPPAKTAPNEKETKDSVSFTQQVAPILVARCGACHIQRGRGELSMASYVSLGKGSKSGAVIMPGDAKSSRMIELIASGDMPRAGGKLTAEELGLIAAWIDAGAKFDGPDPAAPLISYAKQPKAKDDAETQLKVVTARAKDEVRFSRDLGAILLAQCTDCHGERNPRANFSMDTFDRLLRGGDSGAVLAPGKPDESLLVKKLRGTAGARMPFEKPPLEESAIAKIEKWIALGAKFDGSSSSSTLEETVNLTGAENATHDELRRLRTDLAARNWHLMLPDAKANHEETVNLLVYGNVGAEILADLARIGDEQISKLRKLFKVPADEPLIKGRLTLYVFEKRYDYGEVGTMLEHREIPAAWRGHWHFDARDAYGCLLLSQEGQASPGLVVQQIAGAYVASLGKIPRWYAEGTARAVAARFDPKDPRVKPWDDQIARIVQANDKPDGFLTGSLQPEDGDILSYSFVKYLMTQGPRYAALMAALQQGTAFDLAFAKAYGGTPKELIAPWLARAGKRGR